jgi:hypothetical protein
MKSVFREVLIAIAATILLGIFLPALFAEDPMWVPSVKVVDHDTDVYLHGEAEYRGKDTIQVYDLFYGSMRVVSAGKWMPLTGNFLVTASGIVVKRDLSQGQKLKVDYPLRRLIQLTSEGPNQLEIEITVRPVNSPAMKLKQTVKVSLTKEQVARINKGPSGR